MPRQRLWGSLNMAQWLLRDVGCWLEHLSLDSATGLDPPGIKLRAVTGLSGLDYFVQGYGVWAALIQALADMGYDSNNLVRTAFSFFLGYFLLTCGLSVELKMAWKVHACVLRPCVSG